MDGKHSLVSAPVRRPEVDPELGLRQPSLAQHASPLTALGEHHAEGLHEDLTVERLREPAVFAEWLRTQHVAGRTGSATLARDRVPHRELWWTRGPEYLGRTRVNLCLNDQLRSFGGHIGYDVRPPARGHGHATAILAAALRVASDHGIEEALLTCAPDNIASRRVIERNGGRLVDLSDAGRLRFWCPTTPTGASRSPTGDPASPSYGEG
jgi:predicted acetyltransferase